MLAPTAPHTHHSVPPRPVPSRRLVRGMACCRRHVGRTESRECSTDFSRSGRRHGDVRRQCADVYSDNKLVDFLPIAYIALTFAMARARTRHVTFGTLSVRIYYRARCFRFVCARAINASGCPAHSDLRSVQTTGGNSSAATIIPDCRKSHTLLSIRRLKLSLKRVCPRNDWLISFDINSGFDVGLSQTGVRNKRAWFPNKIQYHNHK